jgi:hypothetical protein
MDWSKPVSKITPFIVRIHTQQKRGTGFIFWQNKDYCCIATAYHVVEDANVVGWEHPIYLMQPNGKVVRLNPENRNISKLNEDINGDSAAIFIWKTGLDFPPECLPLWDFSQEIPIGTEVGWLGYPILIDDNITQPSFFSGTISNHLPALQQYVIDGVAINGVSGAPLFWKRGKDVPYVIGTLSSYFPNRVTIQGSVEAWPGVSLSHSFSAFNPVVADLRKIEAVKHTEPPVTQNNKT